MRESEKMGAAPWRQIYRSSVLTAKRQSKHIHKLKKVGLLSPQSGGRLLDVCSGEGEMLDILAGNDFDLLAGVDLAVDKKGEGWYYAAASAEKLPFQNDVFDWVLCAHALHHLRGVRNIEAFLEEARRCLKPGGKLALIDHHDSIPLRAAFWILRSGIAKLTPWSAVFRQQLLAEHEELYDYLDHWEDVKKVLMRPHFKNISYKQELFFFYLVASKG